ncbi:phosphomannomutase/phosphoglucomutase [Sphingomonas populi]|uniref:Phosphomannomutase/phosphoglucomutase n=1 Tax=Sphingomonas populi TaxID=2484750 RepID=A0A4Q6XX26_9SPHN|nr:phosphomannomutase/phosphoglucomutase [Sphingomonas populi]RZF65313.1 phosphomannomutase/phosphoglucomutase [Sphingomonas populi]
MTHAFDPMILREYDVRGVVGATLHDSDAFAIGRGFATCVRRAGGARIAVGYDGRLSSPALEAALVAGLTASGVDVVRIGLGPTPMLYYAEAHLGVDGGIQITGSHNPADQNGFKFVLQHAPFFGAELQQLAALAEAGDWSEGAGTVTDADVLDAYVDRLMVGYTGGAYRIGWDTGNGASGPVIERLVKRLPGEHHLLFTAVDGTFPNHHPDPSEAENLADLTALVVRERLDFGFAFDGDGDRIGAIDAQGRVLAGDQILAVLAEPVLHDLPGATIIGDVKMSGALFDRIRALGGVPLMWKTGHSHMKAKLAETGAPLAGEMTGHVFFGHDFYGVDDAHFAAVRLIDAVHRGDHTLAELRDAMPAMVNTPELRFPVDDARKFAVVEEVLARLTTEGATVNRIDGARVDTADGWWLLRASNTQSALVARAEARDQAGLDRLLAQIDTQLAASGIARPR